MSEKVLIFCFLLCVTLFQRYSGVHSYELRLDKEQDRILWKFSGHYLYTQSGTDLQDLLNDGSPNSSTSLALPKTEQFRNNTIKRDGIWFTKYIPNRPNKFILSYSLKHALFTQGWISFFATPQVEVKVKTYQDQEIGNFWSDGKSWCDAVITMGLRNTITLEITTLEPKEYFLLDKIIMGVFSNVSQLNGRKLNPCLTSPAVLQDDNATQTNLLIKESWNSTLSFPTSSTLSTLSRPGRDFPNVDDGSNVGKRSVEMQSSSGINDTEIKQSSTNNMVDEMPFSSHNKSNIASNRQSRDSGDQTHKISNTGTNVSSHLLKKSSESNETISDLNIEIPLHSELFQTIKTYNDSASLSSGLKCSCSCFANKLPL